MPGIRLLTAILIILMISTGSAQDELEDILARTGLALPPTQSPRIDPSAVTIARLHYGGGGDWYWGSSAIPNVLKFIKDNSNFPVNTEEKIIQIVDQIQQSDFAPTPGWPCRFCDYREICQYRVNQ